MKLKWCILSSVLLVISTNAVTIQERKASVNSFGCPDFQLRCPTCNEGQKCVYPDSGGCVGAGIPSCQAVECPGSVCLVQRIPCPKECPFNCRYTGSPCCPFQGKPECAPVCNTFVACHVTPCPDSCPGDCHYPNADYCCPKSGEAVCNKPSKPLLGRSNEPEPSQSEVPSRSEVLMKFQNQKKGGRAGHKSGGKPNWGFGYSIEPNGWDSFPTPSEDRSGWGYDLHGNYFDCDPNDKNCLFGNHNNNKKKGKPYGNQDSHEDHFHGDDDYFHGLFIGGLENTHEHECSTCTKTVTDIDLSLDFITTTATVGDIVCAQYIIPCPTSCPYDCLYPMDHPCPFTQEPWCPSVFDYYKKKVKTLAVTEGFPFPYFPSYDPFHDIFTSMLNQSGITATTSFATDVSAETPVHACPLIFRYCPVECPDSCLRPDVPCPFAAEGYCPGSSPTTTIPESALITPTAETVVGGDLMCPLYMLACPKCPSGYTCQRDTNGHCPNTNVPYCASTRLPANGPFTTRSYPTPMASLIYFQPAPPSHGRAGGYNKLLRAQKDSNEDTCAKAGLIKVQSKEIFDQIQERHVDCNDCPLLEWDEFCPNNCIYRTEKDCCIQSMCLPN